MSREIEAPPAPAAASDLITALRERAPRAAVALAGVQMAWPLAKAARARLAERSRYTVRVPGGDGVCEDIQEWILGLLPSSEQRALVAWSQRAGYGDIVSPDAEADPVALRMRFDGGREHVIQVGSYRVRVSFTDDSNGTAKRRERAVPDVVFTTGSPAARDALCAEIADVLERAQKAARRSCFRMLNKWDEWERIDSIPPRPLASVTLPPGQMERITADVGRFLAAEGEYVRRGVPWHRGHLYEGPPGTGKTSVARVLASRFGMDVWCLPLGAVKKDNSLLRIVGRVRPRSMLLLEDIDVFDAAKSRDGRHGLSLSGLVNALDGITTPHGLLTVMTTNKPQVLDEAVTRPGRVDLVEHFGPAGPAGAAQIVAHYFGVDILPATGLAETLPSHVVEECKRHDTAAATLAALRAQTA